MFANEYQYVPVPTHRVLEVMAFIVQREQVDLSIPVARPAAASALEVTVPAADVEGGVWPDDLLRRIAESKVKSLVILGHVLDHMARQPEIRFSPNQLEPAVVGKGDDISRDSLFSALGKLRRHFAKWFERDDLPFTRIGDPGNYRYFMTSAQADAWNRTRRG